MAHKDSIHARLTPEDLLLVSELKQITGDSESVLIKKGLKSLYNALGKTHKTSGALKLAGHSVGKFSKPALTDLSSNKKYLGDYGK